MCKLSIVIPVRNRPESLKECLGSISQQSCLENLEVIVVDDGSRENISNSSIVENLPFEVKVVRQVPLGIAQARNRGIEVASGEIILFIDSDCSLESDCLKNLWHFLDRHPNDVAYQLRVIGSKESKAGLMEHLRISAAQACLLNNDDSIKYANTAAFAIRKPAINPKSCFNVGAVRGEDTFLLAELIESGNLPRFVSKAIVKHHPVHSAPQYILKHFYIGYYANAARQRIGRSKNVLMDSSKRCRMLREMRKIALAEEISGLYIVMILLAYILESLGRIVHTLFGLRHERIRILSTFVDRLSETELITYAISNAQQRKGLLITYLTAWTLVQSEQNLNFRKLLASFNLCYADGMGVSVTLLLTKFKWTPKITANDFFEILIEEISNRGLKVAFVGGKDGVLLQCVSHIRKKLPSIEPSVCASGYFSLASRRKLKEDLLRTNPHIVFVGMGQPMQEKLVLNLKKHLPNTIFWCVGGLFDVITGHTPSPHRWVRRCGLEWLFRLINSPKALAKRYLWGLPVLFGYIARENLRRICTVFIRV